jgi:hypothetical protein
MASSSAMMKAAVDAEKSVAQPATKTMASEGMAPTEKAAPASEKAKPAAPENKAAAPAVPIWAIVAAVALTLLTAGLAVLAFSHGSDTPQTPATPELPKEITVTLRATPAETRFSIDNGPPLENPFTGTFPSDRKEHIVRATAAGHAPKQKTVSFDADISMTFVF